MRERERESEREREHKHVRDHKREHVSVRVHGKEVRDMSIYVTVLMDEKVIAKTRHAIKDGKASTLGEFVECALSEKVKRLERKRGRPYPIKDIRLRKLKRHQMAA